MTPIGLDATYSVGGNLSGVGVYSREILDGLARARPHQHFVHAYRPHRLRLGWQDPHPPNVHPTLLLENFWPSRRMLFHGLNQRLPRSRFRRAVCTFHDLFVMTGEYSTPEFRQRFAAQARQAAGRADLLIAVSEFTAGQVAELLGVERTRIRVIPHGVRFFDAPRDTPREPVILSAGALQVRKNTLRLVEAFERAAPSPWRLVLAGSHGFGAEAILERIRSSSACARIDIPGWIGNAALRDLYARSSIFAFPSLDEGFGIPALEAMACGLPVLASNRSGLAEVCAGAALLVDPYSVEEIAAALLRLVEDTEARRVWAERGHARAAQFTWRRAVDSTWKVYEELLG